MIKGNSIPSHPGYSPAFKLQVVREYELGNHTKDSLMSKYQIGGYSTVLQQNLHR